MWIVVLGVLLCTASVTLQLTLLQQTCDSSRWHVSLQTSNANVLLGGLFAIREAGSNSQGCGLPSKDLMQVYEAARWSLGLLNNGPYIPGVRFGIEAYDTCTLEGNALQAVQEFYPQTTSRPTYCSSNSAIIKLGLIGPMSSWESVPVASMIGKLQTSTISMRSASPALSNKNLYPTFLRTDQSSAAFAKAVASLLKQLQWENILIVYTDDTYGTGGYQQILQAAFDADICITAAVAVPHDGTVTEHRSRLQDIAAFGTTAAIYFGTTSDLLISLEALQTAPNINTIKWLFSMMDLALDISAYTAAQGAIVGMTSSVLINEFRDYFIGIDPNNPPAENPWFADWFMNAFQCRLNSVNYAPFSNYQSCQVQPADRQRYFQQSQYVEPTIYALFAYAEAIKRVCGSSTGICSSLQQMSLSDFHKNYLSKVDFTFPSTFSIPALRGRRIAFDDNGDPITADFTFFNYNNRNGAYAYEQFARYLDGNFTQMVTPIFPKGSTSLPAPSLCPMVGCTGCIEPLGEVNLLYKAGDVLVAVLVNAHEAGPEGLACGEAIPDRLIDAVAAQFAVNGASAGLSARGLTVGYLIVDVCPGATIARSFLTNLLGGYKLYTDQSGNIISTNNIAAFIDITDGDTAMAISPILSSLGIPEIRVMSASASLLRTYPYLSLAVPSQETLNGALAQVLSSLKWTYVQMVSRSWGSYYMAAESFRQIASQRGICVSLWATLNTSPSAIVSQLLQIQNASITVFFGSSSDLESLLQAVRTSGAQNHITFVSGTEMWGASTDFISGYTSEVNGALTVELAASPNSEFQNWFSSMLTITSVSSNYFLSEWVQSKANCFLSSSSRGQYSRMCTSADLTGINFYKSYSPYVMDGVQMVAQAVKSVLQDTCGASSSNCSQFRTSTAMAKQLSNYIRNSNYSVDSTIINGEGKSNLAINNFRNGAYSNVGTFDTQNARLTSLTSANIIIATGAAASTVSTQCSTRCQECQYFYKYQKFAFVPGDLLLGAAFALSNSGPDDQRPFICGHVPTNSYQYSAAVMFALNQINSGRGPVQLNDNITLGGFIYDHCNNNQRTYGLVSSIYAGLIMNVDNYNEHAIMPNKIAAWLIDNSDSTIEAAEVLQPLEVPLISPLATSSSLLENPTFFRTVQGNAIIAVAVAKLCRSLGFNFIQVVYTANDYGRDALSTLTSAARQEGVCVISSYELANASMANDAASTLARSTSKVVAMFLVGSEVTAAFLQAAARLPSSSKLILISPDPFTGTVSNLGNNLVNMLSLRLQYSGLSDYFAYLDSPAQNADNPFYARYYMQIMNCNLPGYSMYATSCPSNLAAITSSPNFYLNNYVLSTINAVYSLAMAIDMSLKSLCGPFYDRYCSGGLQLDNLQEIIAYNLKQVSYTDPSGQTFHFLDREGSVIYDVLRYNGNNYDKVGSFDGSTLDVSDGVNAFYQGIQAQCAQQPCQQCIYQGISFSYTPGDIYLGGMFDVHSRGSTVFDCGGINTLHGFQLLEAFHFALDQVNNKKGIFSNILNGVTLGGVGLDACESAIMGGYQISNINNGLSTLIKNGKVITPAQIDLYVGSYSSDGSIYMARILSDLQMPQISYAATSTALDDQRIYPYFYRTVPADDHQIMAMLTYLDKNDIRYVQLLYVNTSFGLQGVMEFERVIQAENFQICVAQKVVFPDTGIVSQESSDDVVSTLLENPVANTIVILADTEYIRPFLLAVQRAGDSAKVFKFVGPTTWGDNSAVVNGVESVAVDAVTLMLDFNPLMEFEMYMTQLTLGRSVNNPWFEEYFQEVLNCYTSPSYATRYPRRCNLGDTMARWTGEDPGVLHVINAVYAAAFAIDATLTSKCGQNYTAVCEAYRNSKDRHDMIRDKLENVEFADMTNSNFTFVNREGNKGYILYRYQKTPLSTNKYEYTSIGTYDYDGTPMLDMNLTPQYDGSCDRLDACAECPADRNRGPRFAIGGDMNGGLALVGVFDIHQRGIGPYQCGPINMEGFQQFLSFFYTFQEVALFSGIRLLALDTCSNSLRVGQDLYGLFSSGELCNVASFNSSGYGLNNIGGVLVAGEDNTQAASRILEPLSVSYVSPNAVSTVLDDLYFLARTITPDSGRFRVLSKFLQLMGFTYVRALYENSGSGMVDYQVMQDISKESGVCLAAPLVLPVSAGDPDIRSLLANLALDSDANVIVLFTNVQTTLRILQAAQDLGIADDYLWVFAVEYPGQISNIPAKISFRALVLEQKTRTVNSFDDYLRRNFMSYDSSSNIPRVWWEDFYQTVHMCQIMTAQYPLNYETSCNLTNFVISNAFTQNRYIMNTVAAAYALGNGLKQFQNNYCRQAGSPSNCTANSRQLILESILATQWQLMDYSNGDGTRLNITPNDPLTLKFNMYHYWDIGYDLYLLTVQNGQQLSKVPWATWQNGNFSMSGSVKVDTTSVCTMSNGCGCNDEPQPGSQPQTGDQPFGPSMLRNYFKYYDNGEQQYVWPIWAIVIAVLTSAGLLITIICFLILLIAYPVRGGTSILGYMTMVGILGIYAINFAFFVHASDDTCGPRRFLMGVVYSIALGAMLVKAIDNWRFADLEYDQSRYRGLTSSCTLFLMALGIVLIQCIIPIEWLILVHPTAHKWANAYRDDYWWCDPPDFYDTALVCSFIFVMFLVLLTAIFAAISFDSMSNNEESRWILAGAIGTAGCFLVWMIVSTQAGPVYRDPAVTIGNLVNATILLICIPLRKLFLWYQIVNPKEPTGGEIDPYSNIYANHSFDPEGEDYLTYEPTKDDF